MEDRMEFPAVYLCSFFCIHAFLTVLSILYEFNMRYLYLLEVDTLLLNNFPFPHVFRFLVFNIFSISLVVMERPMLSKHLSTDWSNFVMVIIGLQPLICHSSYTFLVDLYSDNNL